MANGKDSSGELKDEMVTAREAGNETQKDTGQMRLFLEKLIQRS
jgi:hypothetical protein